VARNAELIIDEAPDTDEARRRTATPHLRPIHVGAIGEVMHVEDLPD
jgi:hypothetical protein